ncbi:hypothetical protein [Geobacter sp. DSM 2909]|jgi:hypothetical protein
MNGPVNIISSGDEILPDIAMEEVNLSLHGANRFLERDIPLEAVEGVRHLLPLLNEKPLKFRYKGVLVVARLVNGSPRIITAWKVPPPA